jgi:signal transduction histidine kinase/CheY-like chemotaxis protein
MTTPFARQSPTALYIAIVGLLAAVMVADLVLPLGFVVWIFYLAPVALCLRQSDPRLPLLVAAGATAALVLLYFQGESAISLQVVRINRVTGFIVIWGAALLTRQVILNRVAIERQTWLRAGQTGLAGRVQGDLRLDSLGSSVLEFLAEYLDARVGAFYTVDPTGRATRMAVYAVTPGFGDRDTWAPGEGLVGQACAARRPVRVQDVPPDYLTVASGLGAAPPRELLVGPLVSDGAVNGVIELGFFRELQPWDLELLGLLSERMSIAVRASTDRTRLENLLEETQRQAEELQTQQEELRVANEELEEQSQALRESQARLEQQQAELEQINSQLEEQTDILSEQKTRLEAAQAVLTEKSEELERASRYKSEFLANMSHELRTPLNSTLILAKLLADNREGNLTSEQVKFARSIYSAGNDLLDLINDILDLSKIESGKMEVKPETVRLARIVETMTQTFRPMAEQKGVRFHAEVRQPAPFDIETDPQRLQQILRNLLSNAVKFTERGEVALEIAGAGDDSVRFSVRDTGVGIPPEQHGVIFEAFRQADGTTNRRFGGTGLGLSISRELAELLGGAIELESRPGAGSTFSLVLPTRYVPKPADASVPSARLPEPAARPAADAGGSAELPRRPDRKAGARRAQPVAVPDDRDDLGDASRVLLVVEDDPAFARILYDLAHEHGFRCVVAQTADEGIQLAADYRPAAVVLDMNLPDHSGLTVLDRLKRNPATRHIPVQVASVEDHARAALEMGAAGYMFKPVRREELGAALSRLERKMSGSVRSVLVVEDDPVQRDSICRLLDAQDVRTVPVDSAAAALEHLRTATCDCMVLDISLPDASGFELLERMAEEEQYSFPPVIVYTGRSLSSDEEQRLRRYSRSIIIKGARSPERLLDEVTLFLHQVEANLPADRRRMLQAARSRDAAFENRTVLIVEDDVRNIFALSSILEPRGARLKIARNGREALDLLEQSPEVDIVLMDIMMPEMNGYEAMREIRRRENGSRVPIIALTAKAMRDDQERCLAAGASDYIAKPIDVEQLLSLMRVWMPR